MSVRVVSDDRCDARWQVLPDALTMDPPSVNAAVLPPLEPPTTARNHTGPRPTMVSRCVMYQRPASRCASQAAHDL